MKLISSAFLLILVNGALTGLIKTSRGIRKGGLLHPFLFVLMDEEMRRDIKMFQVNQYIRGLKVHPRAECQTHQQFMDDTMLMGLSSIQGARSIKRFLQEFEEASGLEINNKKLNV